MRLHEIDLTSSQSFSEEKQFILNNIQYSNAEGKIGNFDVRFINHPTNGIFLFLMDGDTVAAFVNFILVDESHVRAKKSEVFHPYGRRGLVVNLYKKMLSAFNMNILSDTAQTLAGKKFWKEALPNNHLDPMIYNIESGKSYDRITHGAAMPVYPLRNGSDEFKYCWILKAC